MLVLPLDRAGSFLATLGIMLYPGECEAARRKAKAFAAHHLAKPVGQLYESGRSLPNETLLDIFTDGGEELTDLDRRWWGSETTGEIFKAYFILARTHPKLASWENAIRLKKAIACKGESSSRATLRQELT